MANRLHLVVDGAVLAAEAVGADEIVFYVGEEHEAAVAAMSRALDERRHEMRRPARVVTAPIGYVAGEATAAVNAALIARFGHHWYRSAGRLSTKGTALITVTGGAWRQGVREVELGTTIGEIAVESGASAEGTEAVVLGGYFGTWAGAGDVWGLPLDPVVMKSVGLTFGCGIVGLLPAGACGVTATARIIGFLADESAGQCGPCVYGLRAIGDATARVANGEATADDIARIERLTAQIGGRGACHHPDGAVQLMASAMNVFGDEFRHHARTGRCSVPGSRAGAA